MSAKDINVVIGGITKPLSSLRVVDLKELLEKRGLSKSGSKKDLADRLRMNLMIENQRESQKNSTDEDEIPNMSMRNQLAEQNPLIRDYFQSQAELFHSQKVVKKLYEGMSHSSEDEQSNSTQPASTVNEQRVVEEVVKESENKQVEQVEEVVVKQKEVAKEEEIRATTTIHEEPVVETEEIKPVEKIETSPQKVDEVPPPTTVDEPSTIPIAEPIVVEAVKEAKEIVHAVKEPKKLEKEKEEEVIQKIDEPAPSSSPPPQVEPVTEEKKEEASVEKESVEPVKVIEKSPKKSSLKEEPQEENKVEQESIPTKEKEEKHVEEGIIQLKVSKVENEKKLNDKIPSIKQGKQYEEKQQQEKAKKDQEQEGDEDEEEEGEVEEEEETKKEKLPVETAMETGTAGSESSNEEVGLQIHKEDSSESEEEDEEEVVNHHRVQQKKDEPKSSDSENEDNVEIKMKAESSAESEEEEEEEEEEVAPPPVKKRWDDKTKRNHEPIKPPSPSPESSLESKKISTTTTAATTTISTTTSTTTISTTSVRKRAAIRREDVEEVLDYDGDEESRAKKEHEELSWNRRILRLKNRCAVVEKPDKKWTRAERKPVVVTSKILQEFFPDVKVLSDSEVKLEERIPVEPEKDTEKRTDIESTEFDTPMEESEPKQQQNQDISEPNVINVKRKISIIPFEETVKELTPPRNTPSNILIITNLVRPFTLLQLKEMLQRTGTIEDIWVDKIKSKCIAKFEKREEAEETRAALHGIRWPSSNPKTLFVDFSNEATFDEHRDRTKDSNNLITTTNNNNSTTGDNKLNVKIEKPSVAKGTIPVREWDLGKRSRSRSVTGRRRRSSSTERKRSRKSVSPRHDKKSEASREEATGKALDELFRKTITTPCIYWLPLTPTQISEKEEMRRKRMIERERRLQEIEKASSSLRRPRI